MPSVSKARYVVETITTLTTTTVTERRIVREAGEDVTGCAGTMILATNDNDAQLSTGTISNQNQNQNQNQSNQQGQNLLSKSSEDADYPPPIPPKEMTTSTTTSQISGILKGGKLWKQDSISQVRLNKYLKKKNKLLL